MHTSGTAAGGRGPERARRGPHAPRLVGRAALLRRLRALVDADRVPVLLGVAGVGKTRLLDELAAGFAGATVVVRATTGTAGVPLGALSTSIPELAHLADEPLSSVQTRVLDALRRRAEPAPVLVAVDDAHLLDPMSVETLHEAFDAERVHGVVTVRSGEPAEFDVGMLWSRPERVVVEVPSLTHQQVTALAAEVLQGPVDAVLEAELRTLSGGRPLIVIEGLVGAMEVGVLREDESGRWRHDGVLPSHRVEHVVQRRLDGCEPDVRRDAEVLAFAAPLALDEAGLVLVDHDAARLRQRGIAELRARGDEQVLVLSHPVYGEVLRAGVGRSRRRDIARRLADAHDRTGRTRHEPVRVARWRLDGGGGNAELFERAGRLAYQALDYDFAARAAAAAIAAGGGYYAYLTHGAALTEQGALDAACDSLDRCADLAESDREAAWAVIARAHLDATCRADWAAAHRRLDAIGRRLDPVAAGDATAYDAVLQAISGDVATADALLGRLRRDPPTTPAAALLHDVATALSASLRLDDEALRTATSDIPRRHGLAVRALAIGPDLLRAHALLGGVDGLPPASRAEVAAARLAAVARDRSSDRAGLWSGVLGLLASSAGDLVEAETRLDDACALLARVDSVRMRPVLLVDRALVAAQAGLTMQAARLLDDVGIDRDRTPRVAVRAELVTAVLEGLADADAGARRLRTVGDAAVERQHHATALQAWWWTARLGRAEQGADRLAWLARQRPGSSAELAADHAAALVASDARGLDAVARRCASAGLRLRAAEVAAQAADVEADPRTAALASALLGLCPGAATPALRGVEPRHLSGRAREVAASVVHGQPRATIADRLGISVRTVDRHLERLYRGFGIRDRHELRDVFGPALSAGPSFDRHQKTVPRTH